MQYRGDQEQATAISALFGIGCKTTPVQPTFQKYEPGGRQMVTKSSEEAVRCCVMVTTRVTSFPTLPDMCAISRSSRQWPS